MVVTGLMWKSLDSWSSFNSFLWRNPVQWNPATGTLIHNPVSTKMLPWAVSILLAVILGLIPGFILIILRIVGLIRIPLPSLVIDFIAVTLSLVYIVVDILVILQGESSVQTLNLLRIYESKLGSSKIQIFKQIIMKSFKCVMKKKWFDFLTEFLKPHTEAGFDVVGTVLNIIAIIYGVLPYFTLVFLIYSYLDPLFQFQQYVLPLILPDFIPAGTTSWFYLDFARCLFIIPGLRMIHIYSLGFCVATTSAHLVLSCISIIDYNSPTICLERRFVTKILTENDVLNIILQTLYKPISLACAMTMFVGFVLNVTLHFVTIKMFHIIPMPLYFAFPSVAVCMLMMIQVTLPMAIKIHAGGEGMAWKWKYYSYYSTDIKYVRRMIRARQGVRINLGLFGFRFFYFKKSTKATFCYNLLSYTISALMSIKV